MVLAILSVGWVRANLAYFENKANQDTKQADPLGASLDIRESGERLSGAGARVNFAEHVSSAMPPESVCHRLGSAPPDPGLSVNP